MTDKPGFQICFVHFTCKYLALFGWLFELYQYKVVGDSLLDPG